jgi:hypothetical protein
LRLLRFTAESICQNCCVARHQCNAVEKIFELSQGIKVGREGRQGGQGGQGKGDKEDKGRGTREQGAEERRGGGAEERRTREQGRGGERERGRVTPSPLHPLTPSLQTTNH